MANHSGKRRPIEMRPMVNIDMFAGRTVSCCLCGIVKSFGVDRVESEWRCIQVDDKPWYICPKHFPPDGSGREAFKNAYYSAIRTILDGKTVPPR